MDQLDIKRPVIIKEDNYCKGCGRNLLVKKDYFQNRVEK